MSLYMKYLKGWCHVMSGDVTIHACMIHMIYLDMIAILYIEMSSLHDFNILRIVRPQNWYVLGPGALAYSVKPLYKYEGRKPSLQKHHFPFPSISVIVGDKVLH